MLDSSVLNEQVTSTGIQFPKLMKNVHYGDIAIVSSTTVGKFKIAILVGSNAGWKAGVQFDINAISDWTDYFGTVTIKTKKEC